MSSTAVLKSFLCYTTLTYLCQLISVVLIYASRECLQVFGMTSLIPPLQVIGYNQLTTSDAPLEHVEFGTV